MYVHIYLKIILFFVINVVVLRIDFFILFSKIPIVSSIIFFVYMLEILRNEINIFRSTNYMERFGFLFTK